MKRFAISGLLLVVALAIGCATDGPTGSGRPATGGEVVTDPHGSDPGGQVTASPTPKPSPKPSPSWTPKPSPTPEPQHSIVPAPSVSESEAPIESPPPDSYTSPDPGTVDG